MSKGSKHIPDNARFVGAWHLNLGIEDVHEALFLVRDSDQDSLWSITTLSEKITKTILARRKTREPGWFESPIDSGCVVSLSRHGTMRDASRRLVDAVVRARVHISSAGPPYLSGLLTSSTLAGIIGAIAEELGRNRRAARAAQRRNTAPIIQVAQELGLDPRPAGHSSSAWIADCPRRSHWLMISASRNDFGCGYCRRNGGPTELRAFCESIASLGHTT